MTTILAAAALLPSARAGLKINEVFYNTVTQGGYQYVELYNPSLTNEYLDGKILTDEAGSGIEGVYQFPGSPGGTNFPVLPGAFVTIAVDAKDATSNAHWECYAGGSDYDNPAVSNLTLVAGANDLSLAPFGDGIILADGTVTTVPIPHSTVIDGMNYGGGDGELAPLSATEADGNPYVTTTTNTSLSRCGDGVDNDQSTAADFPIRFLTFGTSNNCFVPTLSINNPTVSENATNAVFILTLNTNFFLPVTVVYQTSNGTATAGLDYSNLPPSLLTFPIGIQTQTVSVRILQDALPEPSETFFLMLSFPTNATLAASFGTATIVDDDGGEPTYIAFTSEFVAVRGGGHVITSLWTSATGALFRVDVSTNLLSPNWTNITGVLTGSGPTATTVDTNAGDSLRFYRIINLH